jgi:hypothetical protein
VKTRSAASISFQGETLAGLRIVTSDERPYRVAWLASRGADEVLDARELAAAAGRVCLVLGGDDVHHLVIPLPPMAAKLRPTAIRGVIVREKGGVANDWIADSTALPDRDVQRHASRQDFSTIFARNDVMRQHLGRAHAVGARPTLARPGYAALDDLFRKHRPADPNLRGWNVVHVGRAARFVCVGEPGGLLFSRPLPEDLSRGTEIDEYINRLATEVERSNFFAHQAERSLAVGQIAVCGDADLADALAARLAEASETPVLRWRPEDLFVWPDGETRSDLTLLLAGAVAGLDRVGAGLVPAEFRPHRGRQAGRYAHLVGATGLTAAVPLLLAAGLWTESVQRDSLRAMDRLDEQLAQRAEITAAAYYQNRALSARDENLARYGRPRVDVESLLRDVAARTPTAVDYTDLTLREEPDGGYRLLLSGESHGHDGQVAQEVFLDLLDGLRGCDMLVPAAEPSFLELGAAEDIAVGGSRVVFSLEYSIQKGQS